MFNHAYHIFSLNGSDATLTSDRNKEVSSVDPVAQEIRDHQRLWPSGPFFGAIGQRKQGVPDKDDSEEQGGNV